MIMALTLPRRADFYAAAPGIGYICRTPRPLSPARCNIVSAPNTSTVHTVFAFRKLIPVLLCDVCAVPHAWKRRERPARRREPGSRKWWAFAVGHACVPYDMFAGTEAGGLATIARPAIIEAVTLSGTVTFRGELPHRRIIITKCAQPQRSSCSAGSDCLNEQPIIEQRRWVLRIHRRSRHIHAT